MSSASATVPHHQSALSMVISAVALVLGLAMLTSFVLAHASQINLLQQLMETFACCFSVLAPAISTHLVSFAAGSVAEAAPTSTIIPFGFAPSKLTW